MKIRYLREVYSPHSIAGAQFSERDLEDEIARRLIREGYAEAVQSDEPDDPTDVIAEDDIDAT